MNSLSRIVGYVAAMAVGTSAWAQTELTASTNQLTVSKYVYFNPGNGNWETYTAAGFYEPKVGSVQPRIQLLPRVTVKGVNYISKTGTTLPEENASSNEVRRIRVSLKLEGQLPTPMQQKAILGQVFGQVVETEPPPALIFAFNAPGMPPTFLDAAASPADRAQLEPMLKSLRDQLAERSQLAARWGQVSIKVAAISAVRFTLLVDGESVDERMISSNVVSANGVLPDLFVNDVDEYKLNRIKEGAYQVRIEYAILDASLGSISANFQMDNVMRQLVEESRQMTSVVKKSGVQILGFGSRKTKIQQALREQSREQITQDAKAGTTIEIRDASPTLLTMFESKFFPKVTAVQAVNAHLQAGKIAQSEGNIALAKAHFGYADALQKQDVDLAVDVDAALKSLGKKDYAGFLAKGVKMGSYNGTASADFASVISREANESAEVTWDAVQTTTVQRIVTQILQVDGGEKKAALGLCNVVNFTAQSASGTVYGLVPTCIIQGGAADKAGVRLGEFLGRLNGKVIKTAADLELALSEISPGDQVQVDRLTWQSYNSKFAGTPIYIKASSAPK